MKDYEFEFTISGIIRFTGSLDEDLAKEDALTLLRDLDASSFPFHRLVKEILVSHVEVKKEE